jgi:translation initiation factor IF-2
MAEEVKIGRVTHFFGKIMVAAIELTDGDLSVGDRIHVKGHTSDFTQDIDSMQIERADVPRAEKDQSVGIRVAQPVRVGDDVFKVTV